MGAQILVADDSVTIQKVVELTFSKEDFTLIQARSGEETLRKAKEVRPDLILLDLLMPDKDGYEVCAALRDEPTLHGVPIILLTGTFESFDRQRGAQVGANDFISKPFESQVLIGKVKQLLFAKALEGPAAASASKGPSEAASPIIPPASDAFVSVAPAASFPPVEIQPLTETAASAESEMASPADELQQLLESMPGQTDGAMPWEAPAELRLEDLNLTAAIETPDLSSLDLESLGLEPAEPQTAVPAAESPEGSGFAGEAPAPSARAVEDDLLMAAMSEAGVAVPQAGVVAEQPDSAQPVFELPVTEAFPLPMVEAGKGEPPTLSVEDLLAPPPPDVTPGEAQPQPAVPAPGLEALVEDVQPAAQTSVESMSPEGIFELGSPTGSSAEEPLGVPQAGLLESSQQVEELGPPISIQSLEEVLPGFAESFESAAPAASPLQGLEDAPIAGTGAMAGVEVEPAAEPSALRDESISVQSHESRELPPFDVAAMREEVTARVAQDLTRALGEKLVARFEEIVREVVPNLAEVLITKEIERMRRLADEEKDRSS